MPEKRSPDALAASLTFVASTCAFGAGGYWLDTQLGSKPAFLLVGILIGLAGGFISMLNVVAPDVLPWNKSERSPPDDPNRPDDPAD